MAATEYGDVDHAPETMLAADGRTKLHKFTVHAVVYARDRASAQQHIDAANIYLDRARLRTEMELAQDTVLAFAGKRLEEIPEPMRQRVAVARLLAE